MIDLPTAPTAQMSFYIEQITIQNNAVYLDPFWFSSTPNPCLFAIS